MTPLPRLREVRERRRLSQRELAQLTGVAQSTISHIESGLPARHITTRVLASTLRVRASTLRGEYQPTPRRAARATD